MKVADILGFASILSAGAYGGYKFAKSEPFAWTDFFVIFGLLSFGFYLSVILS